MKTRSKHYESTYSKTEDPESGSIGAPAEPNTEEQTVGPLNTTPSHVQPKSSSVNPNEQSMEFPPLKFDDNLRRWREPTEKERLAMLNWEKNMRDTPSETQLWDPDETLADQLRSSTGSCSNSLMKPAPTCDIQLAQSHKAVENKLPNELSSKKRVREDENGTDGPIAPPQPNGEALPNNEQPSEAGPPADTDRIDGETDEERDLRIHMEKYQRQIARQKYTGTRAEGMIREEKIFQEALQYATRIHGYKRSFPPWPKDRDIFFENFVKIYWLRGVRDWVDLDNDRALEVERVLLSRDDEIFYGLRDAFKKVKGEQERQNKLDGSQ